MYIDMNNLSKRRLIPDGYTEAELADQENRKKHFKIHAHNALPKYWPSQMGTSKLKALDHMVDSLCYMDSAEYP